MLLLLYVKVVNILFCTFVSQSDCSFNSRLSDFSHEAIIMWEAEIKISVCPGLSPTSSRLKDIYPENQDARCASVILQTVNSAAVASGRRKREAGSVDLTATRNLVKRLTPQCDDKWCEICRTKQHLLCKLLLTDCHSMGKKNILSVQFLTSACVSLTGLLGAAIKYAWRNRQVNAFPTFTCVSLKTSSFQKDDLLFTLAGWCRRALRSTERLPAH